MTLESIHILAVGSLIAVPLLLAGLFALAMWTRATVSESTERLVAAAMSVGFLLPALGGAVLLVLSSQTGVTRFELGSWFEVGQYHYEITLLADSLSLSTALAFGGLTGLIGLFSRRYLHRETGFFRFYFLLALFGAGVEIVLLAGGLDLVFIGWEMVGVSSALLIAFFHERRKPVEHGLRAFVTYRLCDIGLLSAAIWMHHLTGSTAFVGTESWAMLAAPATVSGATVVGLLIVMATLGKSAQVPIGGWLPRAMEGPTPSSAIFYGAVSIHLGPYLLLRAAPLLESSVVVQVAVITIGAATALHGTFVGRVQTDIKSALAYASMTQVGIIFVEIGLGLHTIALVHIIGHAFMRSFQILRSPSLLHDHQRLEYAMGDVLPRTGAHIERLVPRSLQPWLYRHALERGYFDSILVDWVAGGFVRFVRWIDGLDQRWVTWLAGTASETHNGDDAR